MDFEKNNIFYNLATSVLETYVLHLKNACLTAWNHSFCLIFSVNIIITGRYPTKIMLLKNNLPHKARYNLQMDAINLQYLLPHNFFPALGLSINPSIFRWVSQKIMLNLCVKLPTTNVKLTQHWLKNAISHYNFSLNMFSISYLIPFTCILKILKLIETDMSSAPVGLVQNICGKVLWTWLWGVIRTTDSYPCHTMALVINHVQSIE